MNIQNISTFRAFRSANYTLYFLGRSISQFGTWMQRTAVVWVVYSVTHSEFMLGLTLFAELFPSFLFSVFGGIAADRYNRYTIIKITQITSMIQASLLAILMLTERYVMWEILTLSVILGIINAFDVPARQSLINEVVNDPADLPSALSLSAAMASIAKLLGPALSGIILEKFGAGICFLLNAASFGGVMLSLVFMKLPPASLRKPKKRVFAELVEGFNYLKHTPSIGLVIVALSIISLLVLPYDTLLPVFAQDIFKGNAATFGYISSFIGLGAVSGTVLLASVKQADALRKILWISSLILSIGLVCFSYSSNFGVAMFFAVLMGFGAGTQFTACNIIVQAEAAPEMRGRAISILLTAIFGMLPLGSLLIGAISQQIGAAHTIFWEGLAGIAIALIFAFALKKQTPVKANPPSVKAHTEYS